MSFTSFLKGKAGINNNLGEIGEDFACEYLIKLGFTIKDRGYKSKFGEIDIISEKKENNINSIYFFEVKTSSSEFVSPYDNMNQNKINNFKRNVQIYVLKYNIAQKNTPYFLCFIAVFLNKDRSLKKIELVDNLE